MYFPRSAAKNLEGSGPLADLPKPAALLTDEILAFDGVVIDVRAYPEYGAAHIPNSINIGLGGQFASWAGSLIPIGTPISIVANTQDQIDEAVMRLARIGHETVAGYILLSDYTGERKTIEQVSVEEINELAQTENHLQFVDVRRVAEHNAAHATRSVNIPLDKLGNDFQRLDPELPTYVICQGGYRSSIGTSILENAGFKTVRNVKGGTAAWIAAEFNTEAAPTACAVTNG